MKLFSHSLTGIAFEWYSNLPPELVPNWQRMEEIFHAQFYQTEPEVTMADLARLNKSLMKKLLSSLLDSKGLETNANLNYQKLNLLE